MEPTYWLTRFLFQRLLALIYLTAFAVVVLQFRALCGERGLEPAPKLLKQYSFWEAPSIFHFRCSDRLFSAAGWAGLVLSVFALSGLSESLGIAVSISTWLLLWLLYQSFVNVGRTFYAFGWESLLLETGFLAIFFGSSDTHAPPAVVWLLCWVLFRVMFGAGLIKIRGDQCWRDLTCMQYHYETQPMPNPLSWYFHRLPLAVHKAAVLFNHFTELILPFAYFAPPPLCYAAGVLTIIFQALLILSGNFSWLNYLTICLAVACFDDAFFSFLLPPAPAELPYHPAHQCAVYLLTAAVLFLSIKPIRNLVSPYQVMNTSFDNLHLVNTYGAFGAISKERREIVIEGTDDPQPGSASKWLEYEFRGKPGNVMRTPPLVAPYHYRLDWQMWFAAMSHIRSGRWFSRLLEKLLEGDEQLTALLAHNPFPEKPPAALRCWWYRYRFTSRQELKETGAWWRREKVGLYCPMVTRKDAEASDNGI